MYAIVWLNHTQAIISRAMQTRVIPNSPSHWNLPLLHNLIHIENTCRLEMPLICQGDGNVEQQRTCSCNHHWPLNQPAGDKKVSSAQPEGTIFNVNLKPTQTCNCMAQPYTSKHSTTNKGPRTKLCLQLKLLGWPSSHTLFGLHIQWMPNIEGARLHEFACALLIHNQQQVKNGSMHDLYNIIAPVAMGNRWLYSDFIMYKTP